MGSSALLSKHTGARVYKLEESHDTDRDNRLELRVVTLQHSDEIDSSTLWSVQQGVFVTCQGHNQLQPMVRKGENGPARMCGPLKAPSSTPRLFNPFHIKHGPPANDVTTPD